MFSFCRLLVVFHSIRFLTLFFLPLQLVPHSTSVAEYTGNAFLYRRSLQDTGVTSHVVSRVLLPVPHVLITFFNSCLMLRVGELAGAVVRSVS